MNKLLFEKLTQRLKEKEIKYTTHNDVISFKMGVDDAVGALSIFIYILDDSYVTYTSLGNKVTEKNYPTVSEYLHRANYGLLAGNFEIDYDDGEVRFKILTECTNIAALTNKMIDKSIILPCLMFKKYGNGILKLMIGVGNPKELIEEAETQK
jgi:hypothetical protein